MKHGPESVRRGPVSALVDRLMRLEASVRGLRDGVTTISVPTRIHSPNGDTFTLDVNGSGQLVVIGPTTTTVIANP